MKVTLIANPPAGDKAEQKLKEMHGIELHYVRNKPSHNIPTIPVGTQYLLAMNAGQVGVALKEHARKAGVAYISIPPSWSDTVPILRQCGFYDALRKEREAASAAAGNAPLTHKPLAAIASKLEEVKPQATTTAPQQHTKAAWTTPEKALGGKAAAPVNPYVATRITRAKEAGDDATKQLRDGLAQLDAPEAYKKYCEVQTTANKHRINKDLFRKLRHSIRAELQLPDDRATWAGKKFGSSTPKERRKWAVEFVRSQVVLPDVRPVVRETRQHFGIGISDKIVKRIVQAERRFRKRSDASGHQSVSITPGELPPAVADAQKKLVEVLRANKAISIYSLTYAGGDAESSFEFTAKGTTKL